MNTTLERVALDVNIRPFRPEDYPAMADVRNAIWPDNLRAAEDIRRWDSVRDPKCILERWVAERDGTVVGVGCFEHYEWMYHPRKFGIGIDVVPELEGQGIGRALYETVMTALEPLDPILVRSGTRADKDRAIRFLLDRGFEEEDRAFESRLDVTAFDFAPYAGAEQRVLDQGIVIHTYGELADRPDHLRRLYELGSQADRDIPTPEPITTPTFEVWAKAFFDDPNLLPDGFFIALDGDEYVGESALWRNPADNDLHTGFTGVHPAWRRRGIALALKLRAVKYARDRGVAVIRTDNSALNRPMLSINERLGFQKLPAWVGYKKVLRAE